MTRRCRTPVCREVRVARSEALRYGFGSADVRRTSFQLAVFAVRRGDLADLE